MGNLKTFSLLFVAFMGILLAFAVYNAFVVNKPCQHDVRLIDEADRIKLSTAMIETLKSALRFKTISYLDNQDKRILLEYVQFVRKEFDEIEKYPFVTLEIINGYSMLYKIQGKSSELKPYLLAAHFDVVPVDNQDWKRPAFEPYIESNFMYGRGTLDDKSSMIAQLEAVRVYLRKNGQPTRTIYLAYGHDEEINGNEGAQYIARHLNNTKLEYVLDEGTVVVEDLFSSMMDKTVALIGIADKGYLTVKFSLNTTGGHSSMPETDNSLIFILSEAIVKMKRNQFPSLLGTGPETITLKHLAVNLKPLLRTVLSNIWLFGPIINTVLTSAPTTNALIRTTTALTIMNSGQKDNVMPSYGEFYVNHRIHSRQSCAQVLEYDIKIINDPRINYEILSCIEPSPVSPTDNDAYMVLDHTTRQIFEDVTVLPGVMLGLTDSRYYYNLTDNIYKYLPVKLQNNDLKGYHGANERISLDSYKNMINFYHALIHNTDSAHLKIEKKYSDEL